MDQSTATLVSLIIFGLGVAGVFFYIPIASDYAFWFIVVAYGILIAYR
jgi:hypothetical protein